MKCFTVDFEGFEAKVHVYCADLADAPDVKAGEVVRLADREGRIAVGEVFEVDEVGGLAWVSADPESYRVTRRRLSRWAL